MNPFLLILSVSSHLLCRHSSGESPFFAPEMAKYYRCPGGGYSCLCTRIVLRLWSSSAERVRLVVVGVFSLVGRLTACFTCKKVRAKQERLLVIHIFRKTTTRVHDLLLERVCERKVEFEKISECSQIMYLSGNKEVIAGEQTGHSPRGGG